MAWATPLRYEIPMQRSHVIIMGAGLVGQTLALALARAGLAVAIVDPADPAAVAAPAYDGRATAVSSSSWRMLRTLGLGPAIDPHGCDIRTIRVADGLAPGGLAFTPPSGDPDPLGMLIENRLLRAALRAAALAEPGISLLMPARAASVERGEHDVTVALEDGIRLTAPLLVGAEGRSSPSREGAGIHMARWRYDHRAIVTTIAHEKPHDHVAWEIFYPAGPFAVLPMLGTPDAPHRAAIIWSVPERDAGATFALPDRALAAEIEKRMGGFLGEVRLAGPRFSYPLGFHHAATIIATRMALAGDAAHAVHPIAGQGLNLGFRDAAALAEILVEGARTGMDLGDAQLLARYQNWRGMDSLMVAMATDSLTRLYAIPGRTASGIRRLGMNMVGRIAPLRRRLTAEARGETGTLPRLLQGLDI